MPELFDNEQNAVVTLVQSGLNYEVYRQEDGTLDYDNYIMALLFNKSGFFESTVKSGQNQRYEELVSDASIYTNEVKVKLSVRIPEMDPYGNHRVWFRWAFFNKHGDCQFDLTCLG